MTEKTVYEVRQGKIIKRRAFLEQSEALGAVAQARGQVGYIIRNNKILAVRSMPLPRGRWFHQCADNTGHQTGSAPRSWLVCSRELIADARWRLKNANEHQRDAVRRLQSALRIKKAGKK